MMASNESEVCYHPETFFICRRLQKNTLMYTQFFGLSEHPFSISPNPKYLYMSERHTEALAHLNYGLHDGGGFVLLTGEVGTGKTTVSRCLRQQLPADSDLALVINPTLTERELLASICDEFKLGYGPEAGIKELFDLLHQHLLANKAAGRIGDTPIIGAGCYANNATVAVSSTGTGEIFMRTVAAYDVSALIEYAGLTLQQACDKVVMEKLLALGGSGGLIAIDRFGNVALPFNSEGMYRGFGYVGDAPSVGIYR